MCFQFQTSPFTLQTLENSKPNSKPAASATGFEFSIMNETTSLICYSLLKASMGSSRAAMAAG